MQVSLLVNVPYGLQTGLPKCNKWHLAKNLNTMLIWYLRCTKSMKNCRFSKGFLLPLIELWLRPTKLQPTLPPCEKNVDTISCIRIYPRLTHANKCYTTPLILILSAAALLWAMSQESISSQARTSINIHSYPLLWDCTNAAVHVHCEKRYSYTFVNH